MKKLIAALSMFLVGSVAYAQQDAGTLTVTPEETPSLKRSTIEFKPLEALVSVVPGIMASGATFETLVSGQWAAVIGGSYADIDISQKNINKARGETEEPLVKHGYGYTAGAGLRFYEDVIGGSTYGGAHLDYSELKSDWNYDDNEYVSRVYAVTPSLAVGYRWVWQNGVIVRLGAGAGIPKVDAQSTKAKTANTKTDEGQKKIEDILDQQVIAKVDFGVGYSF